VKIDIFVDNLQKKCGIITVKRKVACLPKHMKKNIIQFLTWIGWFLFTLGIIGYVTGGEVIVSNWSLGINESLAYLILGFVMIAAVKMSRDFSLLQKFTLLIGVTGLFFAVYGLAKGPDYYGYASFESIDNILHFIVGAWGIYIGIKK